MNIGWEGVVFLWTIFLWPVLVAGFFMVLKKRTITSKGKFFLVSVAVGYLALVLANFLAAALLSAFLEPIKGATDSAGAEKTVDTLATVSAVIMFLLPAISTYFVAKKFS